MSELSVKIQKEDDVRRVNLKSTRFSDLLETISTLFAIRADQFKICYLDEDKDSITVTTDLELKEALTLAKKTNTILRLLIKESKGNKSAPSTLPQPKVETAQYVVKSSLQPVTMEFSTGTTDFFDSVIDTLATGTETVIKSISSLTNESINTFEQMTKSIAQDSQKKVDEQPYVHEALCDSCKSKITGIRYKCGNCDDFDLCERCEGLKSHDSEHVFLKLYKNISPVPKALLPLLYVPKVEPQKPKEEEPIILVANFVKDVSIEDGTVLKKAEKFRKIWRLRNDGKTAWIPGCRLVMTEGCSLGVVNFVEVPSVKPGEEIDISVDLVAPNQPGRYVSYWRLTTNNGVRFGHRIWVDICVAEDKPEPVIPEPIAQPVIPVQLISQPVVPIQPIAQPVTPVQPISQPVAPSQPEFTQISESSDLSGPAFQVKVSEKSLKIKNGNELVDVEFIITKDNELIFRIPATKEVRLRHSLTHLKRWAVVENAITLDFAEWESGFITLQTPIASQIGSLISNRIESILEQAVPQIPPSPVKEVPKVVEVKEPLPHGVTESEMEKLAELGFDDRKKNAALLLKHKGDIVKVVTELVE